MSVAFINVECNCKYILCNSKGNVFAPGTEFTGKSCCNYLTPLHTPSGKRAALPHYRLCHMASCDNQSQITVTFTFYMCFSCSCFGVWLYLFIYYYFLRTGLASTVPLLLPRPHDMSITEFDEMQPAGWVEISALCRDESVDWLFFISNTLYIYI